MSEFTPKQIQDNCGNPKECRCTFKAKPWLCEFWGRSTLACPNVVSAYSPNARIMSQNTGHGEKIVREQNRAALAKRVEHNRAVNEVLGNIRHEIGNSPGKARKYLANRRAAI